MIKFEAQRIDAGQLEDCIKELDDCRPTIRVILFASFRISPLQKLPLYQITKPFKCTIFRKEQDLSKGGQLRASDVSIGKDCDHECLFGDDSGHKSRSFLQKDSYLVKPACLIEICKPFKTLMVMKGDAEQTTESLSDQWQSLKLDHSASETFARSDSLIFYL